MRQQAADAARAVHAVLRSLSRAAVRVRIARASRSSIRSIKVIGPDDMVGVDDAGDVAGVDHLQPPHRQHRARCHRHLGTGARRTASRSRRRAGAGDSTRAIRRTEYADIAGEMIARLREQQTLDALDGLVDAPRGAAAGAQVRDGVHRRAGRSIARTTRCRASLDGRAPGQDPIGVDPLTGGIAQAGRRRIRATGTSMTLRGLRAAARRCWPTSITRREFRELLQRANRANVSFYPIDARGLVVFDHADRTAACRRRSIAAWLTRSPRGPPRRWPRRPTARPCSNTNDVSGAMQKIFARRRLVLPAELLLDQPEARWHASAAFASR